MFGQFIKEIRSRQRLGLREFCLQHGHDASNWSKIERGILLPPKDEAILIEWAGQLDAGRIPDYILTDKELVAKLPVFLRTLSGQKPSKEDLENLLEIIRRSHRP